MLMKLNFILSNTTIKTVSKCFSSGQISLFCPEFVRSVKSFCLVWIWLAAVLHDRKHKTPPPHFSSLYQLLPEFSFHINCSRSHIYVRAHTSSAEPFKATVLLLFSFLCSVLFFSRVFFPLVSEAIIQIFCFCLSPSSTLCRISPRSYFLGFETDPLLNPPLLTPFHPQIPTSPPQIPALSFIHTII